MTIDPPMTLEAFLTKHAENAGTTARREMQIDLLLFAAAVLEGKACGEIELERREAVEATEGT